MSKFEEIETPVLVEPSMLFCKHNRKVCCHFDDYYKYCLHKGRRIQWEKDYKAPYWCPLAFDTLFKRG